MRAEDWEAEDEGVRLKLTAFLPGCVAWSHLFILPLLSSSCQTGLVMALVHLRVFSQGKSKVVGVSLARRWHSEGAFAFWLI